MKGGRRPGAGRKPGSKNRPRDPNVTTPKARLPKRVPSIDLHRSIALMIGAGMDAEAISQAVGLDLATLRERYARELERGAQIAKARNLARLDASAESGNVSAQKKIHDILTEPLTPVAPRLGKKEAADLKAETAEVGTMWEDLVKRSRAAAIPTSQGPAEETGWDELLKPNGRAN